MEIKFIGLTFVEKVTVPAVTLADTVKSNSTHSLGDGLWSIELHEGLNDDSPCVAEFVGKNGCCHDEEADDLWAEVDQWYRTKGKRVIRKGYSYDLWEAPDGKRGSVSMFRREAERGRLHGLTASFR